MSRHEPYISNELVHWTGRNKPEQAAFDIVVDIVTHKRLLLRNADTTSKDSEVTSRTGMVCFTDIPLPLSQLHCERFGRFGIAFHKRNMMAYGANPVLYYTPHNANLIDNLYRKYLKQGLEKETLELTQAIGQLTCFLQTYAYTENEDDINYYQREWRIAYGTQPLQKVGGSWDGPVQPGQYQMVGNNEGLWLGISPDDIAYLVVPRRWKDEALDLLNQLNIPALIRPYEDWVISE